MDRHGSIVIVWLGHLVWIIFFDHPFFGELTSSDFQGADEQLGNTFSKVCRDAVLKHLGTKETGYSWEGIQLGNGQWMLLKHMYLGCIPCIRWFNIVLICSYRLISSCIHLATRLCWFGEWNVVWTLMPSDMFQRWWSVRCSPLMELPLNPTGHRWMCVPVPRAHSTYHSQLVVDPVLSPLHRQWYPYVGLQHANFGRLISSLKTATFRKASSGQIWLPGFATRFGGSWAKGYSLTGNILGGAGPTPSYIWNIPTYVII